ncbi:MAG: rhomboid family intramembrane serine protease, partial [Lachnotalea sp.]
VETFIGKFKYIIIYFSSLILSSLFSFIFSEGVSIGASGAIFGLFGACLIIGIKNKSRIGKGFYQNILSVIIVNLILGFTISNIDNFAHVGGLIAGIGITFILMKKETA